MAKNKSRRERFAEAMEQLSTANSIVAEVREEIGVLKEELESWKDNLPENLQDGSKAGELEEAISNLDDLDSTLEDISSSIDDAQGTSVDFPGMR